MTRASIRLGVAVSLASLAVSSTSQAQTFLNRVRRSHESRQDFHLELRLGAQLPTITREFSSGRNPYTEFFGANLRPIIGVEFDWEILRLGPVGLIGIGASAGFTTVVGNEPYAAVSSLGSDQWGTRSSDQSGLQIIPTTVVAVFRGDGLARAVRWLPIVPYAKAGFAYSFWYMTTGGAALVQTSNGQTAAGGSYGYHVSGGISVLLDVFEPSVARQLDAVTGINHSYAFIEANYTGMGFRTDRLDLSLLTGTAGLGWEF